MSGKALRVAGITAAVVVLLLVATALIISGKVRAYLRSEDFRKLVADKTGEAFRSTAEYAPLRWRGSSLFSDTLKAHGQTGSIVQSIDADQIRAEVNWRAAFSGAWRVDRIDVMHLEGIFQPGSQGPEPSTERSAPSAAGWFDVWLPKRFEFGVLDVSKAHLQFNGQDGQTYLTVTESAVAVRPDGAGWTINGSGGELTVPKVPTLSITDFRSRIQNGVFFLTTAGFRLGESGQIQASGEFADASKIHLKWSGIDVARFLDETWRKRLSGIVAGTAEISWPATGPSAGRADGTFRLTDGLVQHIATLEEIATFTGTPQFRRMPLQELSGNFQWQAGDLTLDRLVVESVGLLRVEGQVTIAASGAVSGTLQVGVTPQTLQWLPGSRERVFTVSRNGYLWTGVRVGGTTEKMTEDLSGRLARAMKDEVIDTGVRTIHQLPEAAREGADTIINILSPLVR